MSITSSLIPSSALALVLAVSMLVLAGCNRGGDAPAGSQAPASGASGAAAGPAASAPPVGVTTVRAQQRDMPVLITATGAVAPLASVDVRPQTTSLVTQVHVKEGQFVRKGELLFTLDSRAAEANVAKARAQMARDEASLADARRQLKRSQELLAQNFVSQGAVDANQATVDAQAALVNADRAAVDAARLEQSYTRITAPSAGRLGAINVFAGSSVQANLTSLVSVTQLDPITVAFSLPQRYLPDALSALKDGGARVTVVPPESERPPEAARPAAPAASTPGRPSGALEGRLKFVDNAVDAATGTVKVKAQFDNGSGKLWPGAFVNVAMTARTITGAVIVPQAAVIQSARGPIVYIVQDNKAVPRPVQVLYAQGDDAAVSGVKPGDRVVLDGRQNLRPGATVVERSGAPRGGASGAGRGGQQASEPSPGAQGVQAASAPRGPSP